MYLHMYKFTILCVCIVYILRICIIVLVCNDCVLVYNVKHYLCVCTCVSLLDNYITHLYSISIVPNIDCIIRKY